MKTHKLRWTEPLSGERLLLASVDEGASKEVLDEIKNNFHAQAAERYDIATADSIRWDKEPS